MMGPEPMTIIFFNPGFIGTFFLPFQFPVALSTGYCEQVSL
ncbi:hypothetical protein MTY_1945 [Moorella thermoacetica Y72]|uniref:Uncharacterized protein n=1 Tax=Moorella thermoacetica Y72 TaxID=1325331 RepID=A0A0S6UEI1_NEOTH|nr:hypothetical protein MTY_1945 [Moorella thermoacetica Y72]